MHFNLKAAPCLTYGSLAHSLGIHISCKIVDATRQPISAVEVFRNSLSKLNYLYNHASALKFLHSTDLHISRVSVSILSTPSLQHQGSRVHLWPQVDTGPLM